MADLTIDILNSAYIKVSVDDSSINEDINSFFTFKDPTVFRRNPKSWDGTTRLYSTKTGRLPRGLIMHLLRLVKSHGWKVDIDPELIREIDRDLTLDSIIEWVRDEIVPTDEHGNPIDVYDYQYEGIFQAIKYKRKTMLAATNAGKSLIIYCLLRYCTMKEQANIVLVVPTVALVHQMMGDMREYSAKSDWDADRHIHLLHQGQSPHTSKPIVISTLASLAKQDSIYFHEVTDLIIDEAHLASSKSFKHVCDSSVSATLRIGMTGTLKPDKIHPLVVQSRIGEVVQIVTLKELQDAGRAAQTNIIRVILKHSDKSRADMYKCEYREEIDYIVDHEGRNQILINLAKNTKGNSLLMFRLKERHLQEMYERIQEACPDKKVFIWSGDTKQEEKDEIKLYVEAHNDAILLGTEKSISTGVSIRNLYNFVFCHPIKSFIVVMQSIGRMVRLHGENKTALIIDINDDLSADGWECNGMKHGNIRSQYYIDEQQNQKTIVKHLE